MDLAGRVSILARNAATSHPAKNSRETPLHSSRYLVFAHECSGQNQGSFRLLLDFSPKLDF